MHSDKDMTKAEREVIENLRNRGFAIIVWYPDELEGVNPKYVQESGITDGYRVIEALSEKPEETE